MKIIKISGNYCGGFKPPKGHLDTQMYPECENFETNRNIVRKTVERRNKRKKKRASIVVEETKENIKTSELKEKWFCEICGKLMGVMSYKSWVAAGKICDECGREKDQEEENFDANTSDNIIEAKKKKKWNPNPFAVCHTTVDKDKNPEKYERCVMDVKKKQAFNLKRYIEAKK